MFKKILFQIHWFLVLLLASSYPLWVLQVQFILMTNKFLKWVNSDSYVVQAENTPKLTPAQLYQHFNTTQPEIKINSITIAKDPTSSSVVNIEKEGERRDYNMMVNPYNAEILPDVKGRKLLLLIQQIHRNLTAGEVGKQITGACALMLIYFVLSGLYLRWPKSTLLVNGWLLNRNSKAGILFGIYMLLSAHGSLFLSSFRMYRTILVL